jgi:hypothetical protein
MTNAMIEIGLISVSVVLGIGGLPIWVVAVMVGVSLSWWVFVHHKRFGAMLHASAFGAFGSLALALFAMTIGHGIGFTLGLSFHAILGHK